MRVGIIGCGAIGSFVARWIKNSRDFELVCIFDVRDVSNFADELGVKYTNDIREFLENDIDVVVESASQKAVFDYAEDVLKSGKDLIVMSVGAFADIEFYKRICDLAERLGRRIYIPSGAIAGIDALSALADYIDEVELVTRKSGESFGVDVKGLLFEGDAREGARLYPRNLNVAVTLGLAVGFEKVRVKAVAEDIDVNVHEIRARGSFGELEIVVKNRRMEENPKTSYLAPLSVIRTLKKIKSNVVIG